MHEDKKHDLINIRNYVTRDLVFTDLVMFLLSKRRIKIKRFINEAGHKKSSGMLKEAERKYT